MFRVSIRVATLVAAVSWSAAHAQTIGDVEGAITRGSQFDQALDLGQTQEQRSTVGDTIPGESGIFVLDVNEIFSLSALGGAGYSTNPSRTLDVGTEDSAYGSLGFTAGVNTVVASEFSAGLNLIASATEFEQRGAPDFKNLLLSGYVGQDVFDDFMFVSLGFSTGVNFNGEFGDATGFYGLSLGATKVIQLRKNLVTQINMTVRANWSDQSEQNNLALNPNAELIWVAGRKWRINANVSYVHSRYYDFFEDVTLTARNDNQIAVSTQAAYAIDRNMEATFGVGYTKRFSSFFLSEFEEIDLGANVRFRHTF
ncbi:MAG: hypothetical protein AAGA36_07165 [Pseudomonadota bacterium]